MGLFGRKGAPPGEPIRAIRRGKVAASHVLEGMLILKIVTQAGETVIEVPGKAALDADGRRVSEDSPEFPQAVGGLVGSKVLDATFEKGRSITLDFGKAGTLAISLVEGDYAGTHALFLKGPGKVFASYDCDGCAQRTM